jgi:hypothetical protein
MPPILLYFSWWIKNEFPVLLVIWYSIVISKTYVIFFLSQQSISSDWNAISEIPHLLGFDNSRTYSVRNCTCLDYLSFFSTNEFSWTKKIKHESYTLFMISRMMQDMEKISMRTKGIRGVWSHKGWHYEYWFSRNKISSKYSQMLSSSWF